LISGLIRVTPDQLSGVATRLRGGSEGIESTLGRLAADVSPLGTDWAGVAQARFTQLWQQWQTSSRQLQQALSDIALLMQGAAADYAANEQSVAARFGR